MKRRHAARIATQCRTWLLCAATIALTTAACGGSSPSGPTPTPPPVTPPASETFTLSGTVADSLAANAPIAEARVQFMTGINAGRIAVTGADGRYTFTGLRAGPGRVRAYAANYPALEVVADVPLTRLGPDLNFGLARDAGRPNPGPFTYSGTVWDSRGAAVEGAAVVLIRDSGANPIGIVTSGADGSFSITTQSTAATIRIARDGFVSVENPAPLALEATTTVNVTIPRITRYALQPIGSMRVGQSATLATEVDTDDGLSAVGRAYTSTSSSDEAIVAVPGLGSIVARAPGTATLTAAYSGLTATATVVVTP